MCEKWELIDEACGLQGMIHEIICKSRLLKNQFNAKSSLDIIRLVKQMENDLDKYSQRLDEIFAELNIYETKLERLEDSSNGGY